MAASTKERVYLFDNLKGLLIALVVMGHMIEPLANASARSAMVVFDLIYLFHMPLFIFVTGLFSKNAFKGGKYRAETPIFYFILCFAMYAALYFERVLLGVDVSFNALTQGGGSAPWYLMAAGLYVLAVPFFARLNPRWAIAAAVFLGLYSGTVSGTDYMAATRLLTFLPFFLLGFYLDPRGRVVRRFESWKSRKRLLALVAAGVSAVLVVVFFASMNHDWLIFFRRLFTARNSFATIIGDAGFSFSPWCVLIARLVWYGVVPVVGVIVLLALPSGDSPLFSRLGSRTLQIYLLHPFVIFICSYFGLGVTLSGAFSAIVAVAILLVAGFLVAWILSLPGCFQRWLMAFKRKIANFVEEGVPAMSADR